MIIAVDGPSGSGKSTASIKVAQVLGLNYLDTGAIYRALAVAGGPEGADLKISIEARPANVTLNGRDVTELIRTPKVTALVSELAAQPAVRAWVTEFIKRLNLTSCVIEGRDIGTVIAPAAELKIFLTADEVARSGRRAHEWGSDQASALDLIAKRDKIDSTRAVAPLVMADDAVVIDSTHLSIEAVVQEIVRLAKERL